MVNVIVAPSTSVTIKSNISTNGISLVDMNTNKNKETNNVIVARPRNIKVSSDATAGVLDSTTPVTIKSGILTNGITRLDSLIDVNASNETDNATLVYDYETDTYVVKQMDLDGGTF